jgi:hypothetical protein
MKLTVKKPVVIEPTHIRVSLPVRYGTEDIPEDFPLRKGDLWEARIEIETGKILDWPAGRAGECSMKVVDEGCYYLERLLLPVTVHVEPPRYEILASREQDYVPSCIPGEHGDYVDFTIDEQGVIENWKTYCTPIVVQVAFFGSD